MRQQPANERENHASDERGANHGGDEPERYRTAERVAEVA